MANTLYDAQLKLLNERIMNLEVKLNQKATETNDKKSSDQNPKLTFEYHFNFHKLDALVACDFLNEIKNVINVMREKGMEGHVVFQ